MSDGPNSPEVDKESRYGKFLDSMRWKARLDEKLAHMALDIPMDHGTKVTKIIKNGLGWKELAVAGGLGLGVYALATREPPAISPPTPAVAADYQDADTNTHRSVIVKPGSPEE